VKLDDGQLIKLSTKSLVNDYIKGHQAKEDPQWKAIMNYSARNGYNIAGFITLFGEGPSYQSNVKLIIEKALKSRPGRLGKYGVIAIVATAFPAKNHLLANKINSLKSNDW
jgi:hypothetical protein